MSGLRRALVVPAAATALLVAACGGESQTATTAEDAALEVVAGFYPLQFVAEAVGGDRVAVTNLTQPGAEAHDLELAPRDVAQLAEADLVVHLAGFQPAVDDAVESEVEGALEVSEAARLTPAYTPDEHSDEDEHADDEHAGGDADEGVTDPHFWLDPLRLADVGEAVAGRLAELDPDGADVYADNAASLREELEALDEELASGLASCEVTDLVTAHNAFGYLAERYGFTQVGISGLSPEDEPDPRTIAEMAELVSERGVTTVYSEVLIDPAVARTVADEAGVRTAVLDPIEGITDESAGDDYGSVMRANLETLQEGQSCA